MYKILILPKTIWQYKLFTLNIFKISQLYKVTKETFKSSSRLRNFKKSMLLTWMFFFISNINSQSENLIDGVEKEGLGFFQQMMSNQDYRIK